MNLRRVMIGSLLALALVDPGAAVAQSNVGGAAADVKNEKLIRELYQQFVASWNRHDVEKLASAYAIDGDHMEPDGDHADGRPAVTLLFKRQHDSVFKHSTLMLQVDEVWFANADVALIDGGYALSGAQLPDGRELPERRGHVTALLLYENGSWRIAASRLMVPTELPYK